MNNPRSKFSRARTLALVAIAALLLISRWNVKANSPFGACPDVSTTWDAHYPSTMNAAGVGWVRFGFSVGTNASWSSNVLASYDPVVNMFTTNGIQVIGLIDVAAWAATNSHEWRDNNYEVSGGNGDNG
jgi:hypothetical protein